MRFRGCSPEDVFSYAMKLARLRDCNAGPTLPPEGRFSRHRSRCTKNKIWDLRGSCSTVLFSTTTHFISHVHENPLCTFSDIKNFPSARGVVFPQEKKVPKAGPPESSSFRLFPHEKKSCLCRENQGGPGTRIVGLFLRTCAMPLLIQTPWPTSTVPLQPPSPPTQPLQFPPPAQRSPVQSPQPVPIPKRPSSRRPSPGGRPWPSPTW